MAILSHQISTDLMLSLKIVLISTSVLGAAVMLKISFPAIADFAVYDVPSIYDVVISWLRPPYLYLVINCIIITIVATTKLQSKKHDLSPAPSPATLDTMVHLQPQPVMPIVKNIQTDYDSASEYSGFVLSNNYGYEVAMGKGLGFDEYVHENARIIGNETTFTTNVTAPAAVIFKEDSMDNKENEYVISKSTRMLSVNEDSTEYHTPNEKLPASVRFGHRRNVKSSPEGGKSLLGVSKAKRHDTLESTWKTITDGRAMPLTRHLRKSDTWERDDNHHPHSSRHQKLQLEKTPQKMTKAETFKDRTNATSPLSTPSPGGGGLGKLRKEPSLGQDELNKRVEAFIKKFNEEMRLQRQESLNQYMEMINRGSH